MCTRNNLSSYLCFDLEIGWKPKDRSGFLENPAKKGDKQRSGKKKQLSAIVTEAKANYQLYTDKKIDKSEKQMLMTSTYDLIKDHIAEVV